MTDSDIKTTQATIPTILTNEYIILTLLFFSLIIALAIIIVKYIIMQKLNDILNVLFKSENKIYDDYDKYDSIIKSCIAFVSLAIGLLLVHLIHSWKFKDFYKPIFNFLKILIYFFYFVFFVLSIVSFVNYFKMLDSLSLELKKAEDKQKDLNTKAIDAYNIVGTDFANFLSNQEEKNKLSEVYQRLGLEILSKTSNPESIKELFDIVRKAFEENDKAKEPFKIIALKIEHDKMMNTLQKNLDNIDFKTLNIIMYLFVFFNIMYIIYNLSPSIYKLYLLTKKTNKP